MPHAHHNLPLSLASRWFWLALRSIATENQGQSMPATDMNQAANFCLAPKPCNFDEIWPILETPVKAILTNRAITHTEWRDCFYHVYRLCIAHPKSHSVVLYTKLRECVEQLVVSERAELVALDGVELLEAYYRKWQVYYKGSASVDAAFRYLNLEYISKQSSSEIDIVFNENELPKSQFMPVRQLIIASWKDLLLTPVLGKITDQLLVEIERHRNGQNVLCKTVYGVLHSFTRMEGSKVNSDKFYEDAFESKLIQATTEYYEKVSAALMSACSISEYMEQVIEKIQDERCRCLTFLPPKNVDTIVNVCQQVLVNNRCRLLLDYVDEIVQKEVVKDLKNMFTLLKPSINELRTLVLAFEQHVKQAFIEGISNLQIENISEQFVEEVLRIHEKYGAFAAENFDSHPEFFAALDRACLQAVNYKRDTSTYLKPAEWLAKYSDKLLRMKANREMTDEQLEVALKRVILVLRYIEEKDVFRQAYGVLMAKRLIAGLSRSLVGEEMMISLLKISCGFEFVGKFARMVTDVAMSRQLITDVLNYVDANNIPVEVPFNVMVLQSGSWPLASRNDQNLVIPSAIAKIAKTFEDVYRKQHNGRKLTWMYHLGTVDVALNYLPQPYLVVMNLHQFIILQCFNSATERTEQQLIEETCMEPLDVFEKNLQTLLESGILLRTDSTGDRSSLIAVNFNYSSKHRKVKIQVPAIKMHENEEEAAGFKADLEIDRKHLLECIVVRVMKQHKVMKHNTLMKETIEAAKIRFTPEISFIKQTIENLIDKNYLKRTDNAEEYAYLA